MKGHTKYFTLSEVTRSLQSVINRKYAKPYWIKAEIAKLNYYPKNGHCYPDLVEKQDGKTKAQMRGTLWSSRYRSISAQFRKVAKEELKDNMTVPMCA
ncbi:MAG: exodeoxyribonuclease VII large subunit, partial [Flavobacteriales bacterium]